MPDSFSPSEIDALPRDAFIACFGDVAERSPWVAERAETLRPFRTRDHMIQAFAQTIEAASREERLDLILRHPDLAGRAKLTDDSAKEQAGAGLDSLSAEEFERFFRLNAAYREKFGFPFIFAVKGAGKAEILAGFEARIGNQPDEEFATAVAQTLRIVAFRLEERVSDDGNME